MVLQPTRRTAEEYRYPRGGLLPRLFTLTSLRGGHSLLRYYTPYGHQVVSFAWRSVLLGLFLPAFAAAAIERVCTVQIYAFFLIPPRCAPKARPGAGAPLFYRDCSGFMSFTRSCVLTVPR